MTCRKSLKSLLELRNYSLRQFAAEFNCDGDENQHFENSSARLFSREKVECSSCVGVRRSSCMKFSWRLSLWKRKRGSGGGGEHEFTHNKKE
ncbi:hypothetical protein JOB18_040547 [Solea senegalensis]|uniref:Uncharacterized protein n=1 Tax=Solea senegalensis TaxID=28829 RepID=A0AAV6PB46_SOLSE|nr:hypothetical protein JOB18_040547 [Solea senegalensis]